MLILKCVKFHFEYQCRYRYLLSSYLLIVLLTSISNLLLNNNAEKRLG